MAVEEIADMAVGEVRGTALAQAAAEYSSMMAPPLDRRHPLLGVNHLKLTGNRVEYLELILLPQGRLLLRRPETNLT